MQFIYIGGNQVVKDSSGQEHNADPVTTTVYGHRFQLNGEPIDVTDPFTIKKLEGNPTFAKVIGKNAAQIENKKPAGGSLNENGGNDGKDPALLPSYADQVSFIKDKGGKPKSKAKADVEAEYLRLVKDGDQSTGN